MGILQFARALVPSPFHRYHYAHSLLQKWESERRILGGRYAGMRYTSRAVGSVSIAKILGTYERELNRVWKDLERQSLSLIVDVGAAEGYHAIGLAREFADIPVIAFEETEQGRRLLHKNVALNELQARIRIDGRCEPEDLARALQSLPALVLVDVEGYEGVLLDPQRVPGLMQCHMVVEIHDHIEPGVGRRIVERFAPSHNVVAIPCESRHLGDIQNLGVMQKLYLKSILKRWMRERIGDSGWLYMTPMYRPHG